MYITHMLGRTLVNRLRQGTKSVLLLGPRQVGKSTLVRSLNPDLTINLADEVLFLSYSKDPGRLKREIQAKEKCYLIVIDEIQRVPSMLNSVQALLDEGKPHRFIFTGSSARKLKRGGTNLLPGRIIIEHLDPLSIWELGSLFELEKSLRIGTLPGIYLDPKEGVSVLEAYTTTYLKEEIQAEAVAKNIGSYARFLDVAAQASGEWINYSKIASDSEIPKETVRRYFGLLEETLLAFRVPAFKPRESARRVSQRDRFVFFDIGVRNAILGVHDQVLSPSEKGKLFEQWFILQCFYFINSHKKSWSITSYRTDAGAEVDLILDVGNKLLAIECKYGKNVTEAQLGGLRSFEAVAHKPVKKYIAYQGETKQKFSKGEIAIPYKEFLTEFLSSI